jgi:hypothetical protein
MIDTYMRLCGTGQAYTDLTPPAVSPAWFDMGDQTNRIFGGGKLVVAKFVVTVAATSGDPDNVVRFQIVRTPITLATPTTARTFGFTVDDTSDFVAAASHGMTNNTRVVITTTGGIPGGLAVDTNYYVRDAETAGFKLAATPGGAVIDITTTGTPAHTMTWYPEVLSCSGPIGFDRLVIGYEREIAVSPPAALHSPNHRYLYAMFEATSDLTAGTFTCDLKDGWEMHGKPFNKVNYVTA